MYMLIGPTITLATLEEAIANKRIELKNEENQLYRRAEELQQQLRTLPARVPDEEGQLVSNKEYVDAANEFQGIRSKVEKNKTEQNHLKEKSDELETIEDDAKKAGQHFVKAEKRMTLSLADAVRYGVTQDMIAKDNNENATI